MTLASLKPGDTAKIISIDPAEESIYRMAEMGLVEGQRIRVLRKAPLGDPLSISIMNYELCLRKKEARSITVERESA